MRFRSVSALVFRFAKRRFSVSCSATFRRFQKPAQPKPRFSKRWFSVFRSVSVFQNSDFLKYPTAQKSVFQNAGFLYSAKQKKRIFKNARFRFRVFQNVGFLFAGLQFFGIFKNAGFMQPTDRATETSNRPTETETATSTTAKPSETIPAKTDHHNQQHNRPQKRETL